MTRSSDQKTSSIFFTLMIRFFSNRYTIAIFDILMTLIISIYSNIIDWNNGPYLQFIIIIIFDIIVNALCIFCGNFAQKEKRFINYTEKAYDIHNRINFNMAGRLYEANRKVTETIKDKIRKKDLINFLINFEKLSKSICDELYNFIKTSFDIEECEISIFQRYADEQEKEYVKMIAFKNNNEESSSYDKEFPLNYSINGKMPVFISIFNDLDAKPKILLDKDSVKKEFVPLEGSNLREQEICQYIGVPVKTKRNKVEILLQIDVSKEKILGKNMDDIKEFAEKIIKPFSNLLYCSFERDLIFNRLCDILEKNIPLKEDK